MKLHLPHKYFSNTCLNHSTYIVPTFLQRSSICRPSNKFNRKKKREKENTLADTRALKKRIHECNAKRIHALKAHKGRNAIALITWKTAREVRPGPEIPARSRFVDNPCRRGGEQSARERERRKVLLSTFIPPPPPRNF